MAYGTPRAVFSQGKPVCIPCAEDLIEAGTITMNREPSFSHTPTSHQQIAWGWANVERVLVEGQEPDQSILEKTHCSQCGKLLRDDCTHY